MSCQRQIWQIGPGILDVFIFWFTPLQSRILLIIEQSGD
jgi:hypothetical protein